MIRRALLRVFGHLSPRARSWVARRASASYYVGTSGFIVDDDGRLLLVRSVYRLGWGAPGGLVDKGEQPADAVVREMQEELGLTVVIEGEPRTHIDPHLRGVDVWFRCRPTDPAAAAAVTVRTHELDEVRWFALDALPPDLQPETRRGLDGLGLAPG